MRIFYVIFFIIYTFANESIPHIKKPFKLQRSQTSNEILNNTKFNITLKK